MPLVGDIAVRERAGNSSVPRRNSLRVAQVGMLLPQMLGQLILASEACIKAFGATRNVAQISTHSLVETMNGVFMADAVKVSGEVG